VSALPRRFALVALFGAALPFALAACGSDKPKIGSGLPTPASQAASAPSASASAQSTAPEYSETDFVENDRNRDPFRAFANLFGDTQKKTFEAQRKVILSQYSLDELKLVAIVQGSDYARAMVVDPHGKGWVIKRGDFVCRPETVHTGGTNGTDYQVNWRVDRVRDGDIVLVREDPAQPNVPPATRVIPLHPEATGKTDDEMEGFTQSRL
jgi:type IV pilus assembly protein PilP